MGHTGPGEKSMLGYIYLTVGLLAIDAAIEMGFVSGTVAFLHFSGGGPFQIDGDGQNFELAGAPSNLMVNQGHTSNGAAGTALVLVGFGGVLALCLERYSRKKSARSSPIFYLWSLIVVLSWLLTLTALIYVFVVTHMTDKQTIDLALAASNAFPAKYPKDSWTPETWYSAVLKLPLAKDSDRHLIEKSLVFIRGWRYNLIAMFILGFVLVVLVVQELRRSKRSRGMYGPPLMGDGPPVGPAYVNTGYKGPGGY